MDAPAATTPRRRWTRDELLLVLHLYARIPFGQQHARNERIIELAGVLGRTPSSVAMKLNNITSLDPSEKARGVAGLPGASALDAQVWQEFQQHAEEVVPESERLWRERVEGVPSQPAQAQTRETETVVAQRVRLGQAFFRRVVLANFGDRCALTDIAHPALVNASHIVAWADDVTRRLDPANGIALNRLHDAAFDQHLITFDEAHRLVVGRRVREAFSRDDARTFFAREGRRLAEPVRHALDPELLRRHREAFARANG